MKVGHRVTYLQWFCQHLSWKNCFSGRKAFFSKDQSTFHPQVLSHTGRITLCHLDKSKTLIAQDQLFLLLRTLGWIGVFIHLNLFKGPQCVFWHWKPCCWTLFFKYTLRNKICYWFSGIILGTYLSTFIGSVSMGSKGFWTHTCLEKYKTHY